MDGSVRASATPQPSAPHSPRSSPKPSASPSPSPSPSASPSPEPSPSPSQSPEPSPSPTPEPARVLRAVRTTLRVERVKGIEPSSPAWKAGALPLSYTRADSMVAQRELSSATISRGRTWGRGMSFFQGSLFASRPGTFRIVKSRGFTCPRSSHVTGNDTVPPGRARGE